MAASARYWYRVFCLFMMAMLSPFSIAGATEKPEQKPFLASSISSTTPFVGQEILLTYTLYFRDVAPKIVRENSPSLQGLWAKESGQERYIHSTQAEVQGIAFRRAVVRQFRVVPIKSGNFTVAGYRMLCSTAQQKMGANGEELHELNQELTAPGITISARALPEPVPEGFSGAVGTFTLALLADKPTLKVGEPITVKLVLNGQGSLFTLALPKLHLPESFRQNPPQRTTTLNKESETTSGSVTETVVAWPQSAGEYHLPALSLLLFNPETKQFSTIHTQPLTLQVEAAAHTARENDGTTKSSETEKNETLSPLITPTAIALFLLLVAGATFLALKIHRSNTKKSKLQTGQHAEEGESAGNLKRQLLSMLEESGINTPGSLTRKELNHALLKSDLPAELRSEIPALLDALDRLLYSPFGAKESKTPDQITARCKALMKTMKSDMLSR